MAMALTDRGGFNSALGAASQGMPYSSSGDPNDYIMQALAMQPRPAPMAPQSASALADIGNTLIQGARNIPSALQQAQQARDDSSQGKIAAIQQAISKLTDLGNQGGNLQKLAFASGMLKPGDLFGGAAQNLYQQQTSQRDFDQGNTLNIAKLAMQKAGIPEDVAEQTSQDAIKAAELGIKASQQAAHNQYYYDVGAAKLGQSRPGAIGGTDGIAGIKPYDFASRIAGIENATGNPAAKNPRSSAMGNGQFIDSTWLGLFKQLYPDQASKMTDPQILSLRADPAISQKMIIENGKLNADYLEKSGLPVTMQTLAVAHRLGPQVAANVLSADRSKALPSLLSDEVLRANPDLQRQTVGSFLSGIQNKVGDTPVSMTDGALVVDTHGDDYLKTISPTDASIVKAMVEGRKSWPGGFGTKNPYWIQKLNQAAQYDPDFDETVYKKRADTIKDFSSAKTAALIRALNQAPLHVLSLADAYDQLHNSDLGGKWVNKTLTDLQASGSDKRQLSARGAINEVKPAVADELATLYKGGYATIQDVDAQEKAFDQGLGPTESSSAIRTAAGLMMDRLHTLEEQWRNAMGPNAPMFPVISDKARNALNQLLTRYNTKNRANAYEPGSSQAGSADEPQKNNSAPQLPASLQGKPGIHYSPSRKQYRDAAGVIYDINGNIVR